MDEADFLETLNLIAEGYALDQLISDVDAMAELLEHACQDQRRVAALSDAHFARAQAARFEADRLADSGGVADSKRLYEIVNESVRIAGRLAKKVRRSNRRYGWRVPQAAVLAKELGFKATAALLIERDTDRQRVRRYSALWGRLDASYRRSPEHGRVEAEYLLAKHPGDADYIRQTVTKIVEVRSYRTKHHFGSRGPMSKKPLTEDGWYAAAMGNPEAEERWAAASDV